MSSNQEFYRRNLPHWQPQGCIYFVTFRLANSLPREIIRELIDERDRERRHIYRIDNENEKKEKLYHLEVRYFSKYDAWLDRCIDESPRWLAKDPIAQMVDEELHKMDGEQYQLIAYCILPNHVHLLINIQGYDKDSQYSIESLRGSYTLTKIIRLVKGRTARSCNQLLGRTGSFWQHESYDHVVRDAQECERIIRYILDNPVKVGLVSEWRQWPYTYLRSDFVLV